MSRQHASAALLLLSLLGSGALVAADAVAQPALARPAARPVAPPAPPARVITAIVGAAVHTGAGEVIEGGVVVVEDGKISAVGEGIAAPQGARVVDAKGSVVTPGLTDALTSMGIIEIDLEERSHDDHPGGADRIRAAFRAADGYNPASCVIGVTRAEGVTSVGVIPNGGLISGQSAWADLDGVTAADAIAAAPLALHVHIWAGADPGGGGHAAALLRVREAFDDARVFARTRAAWERNQSRPFTPSRLDLEALAGALGGRLPVVFHVDRAADILASLALAKELGLRPVIAGGAEGWRVAREIAAAKAPVIVFPLVAGPTSFDVIGARDDNAARLHAAGVKISISTGETHNARKLRQVAGNAVRAGLPHEAALSAITSGPAEALGMAARYGTLAPGKVANLVVWSGDPLEIGTRPRHVLIRGREVPLANRQTALLARYRGAPPGTPGAAAP